MTMNKEGKDKISGGYSNDSESTETNFGLTCKQKLNSIMLFVCFPIN